MSEAPSIAAEHFLDLMRAIRAFHEAHGLCFLYRPGQEGCFGFPAHTMRMCDDDCVCREHVGALEDFRRFQAERTA
jgi:hypothetical protein